MFRVMTGLALCVGLAVTAAAQDAKKGEALFTDLKK